jgi:hypothetical protein
MKCAGQGKQAKVISNGKGRPYRICPLCGLHQYFNYGGKVPSQLPMQPHEIRWFTKEENAVWYATK